VPGKGVQVLSTWYLAQWSESWDENPENADKDKFESLGVFACMSFAIIFFMFCQTMIFLVVSLKVSRRSHDAALWAVLRSPMSFVDKTPTGHVLSRFSADLQKVDMQLRNGAQQFLNLTFDGFSSLAVSSSFAPIVLLFTPILLLAIRMNRFFRTTMRELSRLQQRSKGPLFQGLEEAFEGMSSIRAYQRQQHFMSLFQEQAEKHIRMILCVVCVNRWLAIRLRAIALVPVAVTVLTIVLEHTLDIGFLSFSASTAGIALMFILQFSLAMETILVTFGMVEASLIALERIKGFMDLTVEPALIEAADGGLDKWPSAGMIEFDSVVMRYRQELPLVLHGVSFTIPGGTSVGVVGRSGAGKSSLLQALFRICPLESGTIRIDGNDIAQMGLHTLRRCLSVIPQDPVGFTGTFRFNLDPFEEFSDDVIQGELKKVQLMDIVEEKGGLNNFQLTAGGENLSVGQRQLMCATRAFLRKAPILVLDEATASVDLKTDELIQQMLKETVTDRKMTTLTIAHRVKTILGYNNVLVMDHGLVAEFGPTQKLAADPSSTFYTFLNKGSAPPSSMEVQQGLEEKLEFI